MSMDLRTAVIPPVLSLETVPGFIRLSDFMPDDALLHAVPIAADLWGEHFPDVVEKGSDTAKRPPATPIRWEPDPSLAEEEYQLQIRPEAVTLSASTPKGAWYALTTLVQLGRRDAEGTIGCADIHDKPDLPVRAFSDDISRGQISSTEDFRSIIRRLSFYKYNVYMPYMEDTFRWACAPDCGRYADPTDASEWKALVAYAARWHVRIIPIFNFFGHCEKLGALSTFQDWMLRDPARPDAAPNTLDVRSPFVRGKLCDMLDEAVEVFGDAGVIHVGGDEVFQLTRQFPKEEAAAIYNEFHGFLRDELEKRGCRMWLYADMYTRLYGSYQLRFEDVDGLPADVGLVYWDYNGRQAFDHLTALAARGRRFFVSSATQTWSRFLPFHDQAWRNTQTLAGFLPEQCEGFIQSAWGDGGMNLREENWFGILAGALFGWRNRASHTQDAFIRLFFLEYFGVPGIDPADFHRLYDLHRQVLPGAWDPAVTDKEEIFWYYDQGQVGTALYLAFWADARRRANELDLLPGVDLRPHLAAISADVDAGLAWLEGMTPARNRHTLEVMRFDARRQRLAMRKLLTVKEGAYAHREEAMAHIPALEALLGEIADLRKENRRIWHETNRPSEWAYCEAKYLDLEDSIRSLIRYCRHAKTMGAEKRL